MIWVVHQKKKKKNHHQKFTITITKPTHKKMTQRGGVFLGSALRRIRKRPIETFKKWKIVRGDEVMVTAGKDKGSRGIVREVLRTKNKVLVDGVNYVRKRVPSTEVRGGHLSIEAPVAISNVALVDPASGAPSKVAFRYVDGTRVRVAKKSGSIIARPEILLESRLPRRSAGTSDTKANDVLEVTYISP